MSEIQTFQTIYHQRVPKTFPPIFILFCFVPWVDHFLKCKRPWTAEDGACWLTRCDKCKYIQNLYFVVFLLWKTFIMTFKPFSLRLWHQAWLLTQRKLFSVWAKLICRILMPSSCAFKVNLSQDFNCTHMLSLAIQALL